MAAEQIIVVGGGLAGLSTTIKISELGVRSCLVSIVPVKRSHSVCAQGGINAAVNLKGEGDHPDIHFDDTIYGGDFLANQGLVREMCYKAPEIIRLLDRMGVPFNRTDEGLLDFRRFGGTLHHRTAYAGATTGQQLMYALDEQVRRYEAQGLVTKYENTEFLGLVLDDNGRLRGVVIKDIFTGELTALPGSACVICTGGPGGLIFGKSTNSVINTGAAASRCYQQGVRYANGEFIQIHPTAMAGADKFRLISESVRGEGGRVWVPRKKGDTRDPLDIPENERWYFLEEKFPKYGNLVPRDVASRVIHQVCVNEGMGVGGKKQVYLDVSHIDRETLRRKLGGVLEIYEKFAGEDPYTRPMKVYPAVHYSMGGLWTNTTDGMTNIPGVFAAGEVNYQYHGANRLGANSLISCIFEGLFVAGPGAVKYARNTTAGGNGAKFLEQELARQREIEEQIRRMDGPENPFSMMNELGEWMSNHVTVVRENKTLEETAGHLRAMLERWNRAGNPDKADGPNQMISMLRALKDGLILAEVITRGALLRDESRGAHYKPAFPKRDDARFLKTTIATHSPDGPVISYEDVDVSFIPPRERKYT
ncbi:MAG: succinate dehydrogenase flavoprotein subunit [Candidatus Sumerlaeia bacterium]